MLAWSVCPSEGYVLLGTTADDQNVKHTCSQSFELFPQHGQGIIQLSAFGAYQDDYQQYNTAEPPKLAAGDFLGRNSGQVELFADLVQSAGVNHPIYRDFQLWDFDEWLRPKKVSEERSPTSNQQQSKDWTFERYVDFVTAARLHGQGGTDDDRDQVVMTQSEYPNNYYLNVLTFDNLGKQTIHRQQVPLFILRESDGLLWPEPLVIGLAVGRFDPPDNDNTPDFDQQISLAFESTNTDAAAIGNWSVDNNWSFKQLSLKSTSWVYNPTYNYYPGFDEIDGGLFSGDAQGRSLRLGTPYKVTLEDHIQPSMVLAIPPMHVDYIRDWQLTNNPQVMNFTVYPANFNTLNSFTSTGQNQFSASSTSDVDSSVGVTFKEQLRLGDKDGNNLTIDGKEAFKHAWQNSTETKGTNYSSLSKSVSATTGFSDHIYFTSKRLNIYYYPVLGSKVCPQGMSTCPPDQLGQQYIQFSGPDMIESVDLDATTQEWYQPVQEAGNIFSYPWNLAQMQLVSPFLNPLSTNANADWKQTDTSTGSDTTKWSGGGQQSQTTGSVQKDSQDYSASVTGNIGNKKTYHVSAGFQLDYARSTSLKTINTDTMTLDASTGIQVNKPGFPTAVRDHYFYYYQALILGENPAPGSLFPDSTLMQDGHPVGLQFSGPLTVAFLADPFHFQAQAQWWKQAYNKPDIALNHPARWTWDPNTKAVTFNAHEPLTDSPDLRTILNDVFYHMKGFFIGEASDDPDSSPQLPRPRPATF